MRSVINDNKLFSLWLGRFVRYLLINFPSITVVTGAFFGNETVPVCLSNASTEVACLKLILTKFAFKKHLSSLVIVALGVVPKTVV